MHTARNIVLFMAALVIFMGIMFESFSIYIRKSAAGRKKRCVKKTCGVVTDVIRKEYSGWNDVQTAFCPVFSYKVGDRKITQKSHYGNVGPEFYAGQDVTVYYNPGKPEEYYISAEKIPTIHEVFTVISIDLLASGLVFMILGLVLFR